MKLRVLALIMALTLAAILPGCGENTVEEEDTAPPPQTGEVQPPEETEEPEVQEEPEDFTANPLTGLPLTDETAVNRRPVAVMLNNLKKALPQAGISQADLIYEVSAEGGVTRMMAVYQEFDGLGEVGTVRSSRPYYLELALGLDAIYVHAGGSPDAYTDISAWDVDNIDGVNGSYSQGSLFWRDAQRRAQAGYEHSLMTSGELVTEYLEETSGYRLEHEDGYDNGLSFTEDGTPPDGTAAEEVTLAYTNSQSGKTTLFQYDPEERVYLVSEYGGPYVDAVDGEQVAVTNVLALFASTKVVDSVGRLSITLTGTGGGCYFCGGQAVEINWSKADRNSPFQYTLADGTPLVLGVGKTYIGILPDYGSVEYN